MKAVVLEQFRAEHNLVKVQHDLIIGLRKGDVVFVLGRHSGFAGVFVETAKIRDCRIVEE